MAGSPARNVVISLGAAIGGLLVGNLLFPPEPGQGALDALPFTAIGAFGLLWPAHRLLEHRIDGDILRYLALLAIGTLTGGLLLGAILAIAGVSQAKVINLALIGACYGGLTAVFWAVLRNIVDRIAAQ